MRPFGLYFARRPLRLWLPTIHREEWGTRYWRYVTSLDDGQLYAARNIATAELFHRSGQTHPPYLDPDVERPA